MSKELIRLQNLCMEFDGERILDDINLYFNDHEFLTLLGPSGCGKSTTLRIIGGFLTPTSGTVTFDGKVINDVPPYQRQVNTVFQRYALFPHLDVYDNIAFGLKVAKLPKDEIDQRVHEILDINELLDERFRQWILRNFHYGVRASFGVVLHQIVVCYATRYYCTSLIFAIYKGVKSRACSLILEECLLLKQGVIPYA